MVVEGNRSTGTMVVVCGQRQTDAVREGREGREVFRAARREGGREEGRKGGR